MSERTTYTEMPEIITVPELAKYLRIGMNAAYELVNSGRIPAVRVGRQIRIAAGDVEAFLHGQKE